MGHADHHAAAGQRAVHAEVVTVSTSRGRKEDRSGPLIAQRLVQAGHTVVATDVVPDDGARIRDAVAAAQARGSQVLLFTGGTGLSHQDGTIEALAPLFTRVIPGFGELFRVLSWEQIGAAAMLSRASAGLVGELVVFAVPGSPQACELAMDRLILPELAHIVYELGKEAPAPAAPAAPLVAEPPVEEEPRRQGGVELRQVLSEPPPEEPETEPIGWQKALADLGATLERGARATLPEPLTRLASVMDVLSSAGEEGAVTVGEERYAAFGFPDLRRVTSKVLLIGPGAPWGEVIALHRWPQRVGVSRDGGGQLPATGRLSRTSQERTGQEYPDEGRLLAAESDVVWVRDGDRVVRWDGRHARVEGGPGAVLGSLLLRWSQR